MLLMEVPQSVKQLSHGPEPFESASHMKSIPSGLQNENDRKFSNLESALQVRSLSRVDAEACSENAAEIDTHVGVSQDVAAKRIGRRVQR